MLEFHRAACLWKWLRTV